MAWYGLEGIPDKTNKLSMSNHFVRDKEEYLRYPVMPLYPHCDIGGSFGRLMDKLNEREPDNG